MADSTRCQLFVNYASCVYKMGELQKGIDILERQHAKQPSGLVYETLGYLYVEAGDYEKALALSLIHICIIRSSTSTTPMRAWTTSTPSTRGRAKRPYPRSRS